jgi:hypothetical protein
VFASTLPYAIDSLSSRIPVRTLLSRPRSPRSSSLRQSLLSLDSQHALQRTTNPGGHVDRMKSMINIGGEFYAKAVV